jgi:threonine synthase
MRYTSTRDLIDGQTAEQILLSSLPPSTGLFVPVQFPSAKMIDYTPDSFQECIATLLTVFAPDMASYQEYLQIIERCYEPFGCPEPIQYRQVDGTLHAELFHGPTGSFEDIAMLPFAALCDRICDQTNTRRLFVSASSGNLGPAAMFAALQSAHLPALIFYPLTGISAQQRQQMEQLTDNVSRAAVPVLGTFDDCQSAVKEVFDPAVCSGYPVKPLAPNSLNWFYLIVQAAVHIWTAHITQKLWGRRPRLIIPSGNFGNACSAYIAAMLGADLSQIVVATNTNTFLSEFFQTGAVHLHTARRTSAPSMDVAFPLNFERYMWFRSYGDRDKVAAYMGELLAAREMKAPELLADFIVAEPVSDTHILETIRRLYEQEGHTIDPHTAAAVVAASRQQPDDDMIDVVMSTASPDKFSEYLVAANVPPAQLTVSEAPEATEGVDPARIGDLVLSFATHVR